MRAFAGVAQSVEQLIRNEKVGGSIPLSGTNFKSPVVPAAGLFCWYSWIFTAQTIAISAPFALYPIAFDPAWVNKVTGMFEQTFKNIDDILHKDSGCTSELDYTEQSSWWSCPRIPGPVLFAI